MKVDRSLFLALCGTIAAGGACQRAARPTTVPVLDLGAASASPEASTQVADPKENEGPKCDDTVGDAPSCESLGGGNCDLPGRECYAMVPLMKPGVATHFVSCMRKFAADRLCGDVRLMYSCEQAALKGACPDPTAKEYCAKEHDPTSEAEAVEGCAVFAAGMNAEGRRKLGACSDFSCLEGMLQEQ